MLYRHNVQVTKITLEIPSCDSSCQIYPKCQMTYFFHPAFEVTMPQSYPLSFDTSSWYYTGQMFSHFNQSDPGASRQLLRGSVMWDIWGGCGMLRCALKRDSETNHCMTDCMTTVTGQSTPHIISIPKSQSGFNYTCSFHTPQYRRTVESGINMENSHPTNISLIHERNVDRPPPHPLLDF